MTDQKEFAFCYSCGANLNIPGFKGNSDIYCVHCIDPNGELQPREKILKGVADWLMQWQPNITEKQAMERADHYLKSMPAWAKD